MGDNGVHDDGDVIVEALTRIDDLSERERDVFDLLGFGLSNREISSSLKISEATVRTHVTRILSKLGVNSRLQAGLACQLLRWLEPNRDRKIFRTVPSYPPLGHGSAH